MEPTELDFLTILQILTEQRVDFIVVGGVCAALHGAAVATFDIDIVHSRTPENLDRLVAALEQMNAIYRDLAGRKIQPTQSHLVTEGQHLLMTSYGPLDVLGTIAPGHSYNDLLPHTELSNLDLLLSVRVLELPALIQSKEAAGRDKDKFMAEILRGILQERQRNQQP